MSLCQSQNADDEILYRSVKCLEAYTVTYIGNEHLEQGYNIFVNLLGSPAVYNKKSQMAYKVS